MPGSLSPCPPSSFSRKAWQSAPGPSSRRSCKSEPGLPRPFLAYPRPSAIARSATADLQPKCSFPEAEFMAISQVPISTDSFTHQVKNPAWKHKPTWYMVATSDRSITASVRSGPQWERRSALKPTSGEADQLGGRVRRSTLRRQNEAARTADGYACVLVEVLSSARLRSPCRWGNLLGDAPYLECSH